MKNLKKIGEGELILLVQEGNAAAFDELYDRYHKLVYFVAFKMCHNDADAQDVLQETFIEMKRSIKNLQKPSFFKLWMYRIINSKCKKLFRKNKFDLTELEHNNVQYALLEDKQDYLPDKDLRYQNDANILHRFIDELPESQRMAVILFYMEQMTSAEIASVCDVSEGTIKSRLFTARNTLRKKIELYEKQEGISLNFHDLSAAITSSLTAQFAMNAITKAPLLAGMNALKSNLIKIMKANAIVVKTSIAFCATALAATGGYALYEQAKQPSNDIPVGKAFHSSSFPTTTFKDETISSSKDAYYALRMNYCKQDLDTLSLEDQEEVDKLFTALKEENGPYYKKLLQANWNFK